MFLIIRCIKYDNLHYLNHRKLEFSLKFKFLIIADFMKDLKFCKVKLCYKAFS